MKCEPEGVAYSEPSADSRAKPLDDTERTIADCFRRVAQSHASRPAVRDGATTLTYAELDAESDCTACEIPSPIEARHDAGTVCALVGALKRGSPYVALDPEWPDAHRANVLREAGVIAANAGALAAISFTSGSTGCPRGIAIAQQDVLAATRDYQVVMDLVPDDRIAWLSPLTAGASNLPIFGALLTGACLCPFSVKQRGFSQLRAWIEQEGITVLPMVTSLFRHFAQSLPPGPNLPSVRLVKLGGEPVLRHDTELFHERFHPSAGLLNGLGLTEFAGNVCFYRWPRGTRVETATLPVGRAVERVELRVTDSHGQPLPDGETGEIVARTTRAVLRTGDAGRFLPSGDLVHMGRLDERVKIRGHFVHLAEVEAALLDVEHVREAAVVAVERRGNQELSGFVVAPGAAGGPNAIREALRQRLPPFMIPSRVDVLEDLPRLPGGKVDRAELARRAAAAPRPDVLAPRDPLEIQLARVWEKILGAQPVSVTDDFFQLGGDSLAAVRLCALLDQRMHINLPPEIFRDHSTIEQLAAHIRSGGEGGVWQTAVLLNAGNSALPLFLVPGAGVDVIQFVELARRLGPEVTVYTLRYPGLDGSPFRHTSVPELASHFLSEIRRLQPRGSYQLAGVSLGGVIAFEMAQQLSAAGETVSFLGLFDAMGPGYLRYRKRALIRYLPLIALRWFLPINTKHEVTWSNFFQGLREHWIIAVARARLLLRPGGIVAPYDRRFLYVRSVCLAASARYRPAPYAGRVDLFRAMDQPPEQLYDLSRDMKWGPLVRGELVIHDVPGNHYFHIHEPHAPMLAGRIKARISVGARVEFPSTDRAREIWDRLAGWWDDRVGEDGRADSRDALTPVVDRLLGIRPGERVVDAACGNGWYARRLSRAGARVVAFDFSEALVARARPYDGPPIEWQVRDATRAEDMDAIPAGSFDAAVCVMALMDVSRVDVLFAAIHRWLKPGGRFVFSIIDPDAPGFAGVKPGDVLTHIGPGGQPVGHPYFHRAWPDFVHATAAVGLAMDSREVISIPSLGQFVVARLVRA